MKCEFKYCNNEVSEESIRKLTYGYTKNAYCSLECARRAAKSAPKICDLDGCCNFLKKGQLKFCSRSCSAINSNNVSPKREKTKICNNCTALVASGRKYCDSCAGSRKHNYKVKQNTASSQSMVEYRNTQSKYFNFYFYLENIVADIVDTIKVSDLPVSNNAKYHYPSATIRKLSRRYVSYILGENTPCQFCGYEHFTEVCHINSLKDESEDALLKNIITFENMVILCPNCHKELDNDMIGLTVEYT